MDKINNIGNITVPKNIANRKIGDKKIEKGSKKSDFLEILRKTRIEELKKKINNDDYINEAINKLANSLTAGLMK